MADQDTTNYQVDTHGLGYCSSISTGQRYLSRPVATLVGDAEGCWWGAL